MNELKEYIKKSDGMVNLIFYSEFNVRMPIIWKFKKSNESCSLSEAATISSTYLRLNLGLLRLYSLSH